MAGGSGTRFWPVSRSGRPKQFLPPGGGAPGARSKAGRARAARGSLLAGAVERLRGLVPPERTLVVASEAHERLVRAALPGFPRRNLILEPEGRNTAPCLALAAHLVEAWEEGAILAAFPADHHVARPAALRRLVRAAAGLAAERDAIVTLGMKPSWPETGYGYIERGRRFELPGSVEAYAVRRFTEKPTSARARRFLASGRYYWNAGIFVWRAARAVAEFERFLPETARHAREAAIAWRRRDRKGFARSFARCESISVDYAVMERARGLAVLPADVGWSDIGSWTALREVLTADAEGNIWLLPKGGTAHAEDARGLLVRSSKPLVAALGVENLIVVETEDALLLCAADRAQEIGDLVKQLRAAKLDSFL